MTIWVDVYNRTTGKKQQGPILLNSAKVTRVLDGIGSIEFTTPLVGERAKTLLVNEAVFDLYTDLGGTRRLVGSGVITSVKYVVSGESLLISCSGHDLLQQLKRKSTLLNFAVTGSVAAVASALASLAGWSIQVSGTWPDVSVRYDGESVIGALTSLAGAVGAHIRQGESAQTVELGAFGESLNILITNPQVNSADAFGNQKVLFLTSLEIGQTSDALATWLIPFGGGSGKAALTLEKSDRAGIFTTTGPDGSTLYGIKDIGAISEFGEIQQTKQFSEVVPTSNTTTSQVDAANTLFDVATAWLSKYSRAVVTYKIAAINVTQNLRPGDKVRLLFTGVVDDDGEERRYLEIDDFFYIMKVTENLGESASVNLEISSVDRFVDTAAKIVADQVKSGRVAGLKPAPTPFYFSDTLRATLTVSTPAVFPVFINDQVLDLISATFTFQAEGSFTGLSFYYNGTDQTARLGGPWSLPVGASLELDVIDLMKTAGVKGTHQFEVRTDSDTGSIVCNVKVVGSTQAVT